MEKSNVIKKKISWGVLLEFRRIGLTKWGCLVCKKVKRERERECELTEMESLLTKNQQILMEREKLVCKKVEREREIE